MDILSERLIQSTVASPDVFVCCNDWAKRVVTHIVDEPSETKIRRNLDFMRDGILTFSDKIISSMIDSLKRDYYDETGKCVKEDCEQRVNSVIDRYVRTHSELGPYDGDFNIETQKGKNQLFIYAHAVAVSEAKLGKMLYG